MRFLCASRSLACASARRARVNVRACLPPPRASHLTWNLRTRPRMNTRSPVSTTRTKKARRLSSGEPSHGHTRATERTTILTRTPPGHARTRTPRAGRLRAAHTPRNTPPRCPLRAISLRRVHHYEVHASALVEHVGTPLTITIPAALASAHATTHSLGTRRVVVRVQHDATGRQISLITSGGVIIAHRDPRDPPRPHPRRACGHGRWRRRRGRGLTSASALERQRAKPEHVAQGPDRSCR
jgi:hypothetical protein